MPASDYVKVFLGLGGNQGDVTGSFLQLAASIHDSQELALLQGSSIYRSKPCGTDEVSLAGQDDYLNQVIEVETSLSAIKLLEFTQSLEIRAGRNPDAERWSARPLDVDILLYSDQRICLPHLKIPHPRMLQRAFVLVPLLELLAASQIPGFNVGVESLSQLAVEQQLELDQVATKRYKNEFS